MGINKLGQQTAIDLKMTEPIVCEKCGKEVFVQGVMLRKVSALLTGTGQPGIIPVPVFYCAECGHVNQEFIPVELREQETDEPESKLQ